LSLLTEKHHTAQDALNVLNGPHHTITNPEDLNQFFEKGSAEKEKTIPLDEDTFLYIKRD